MNTNDVLNKLIAEIERRESEIKSQIAELGNFESNEIGLFNYLGLYDDILSIITSLQQEQPSLPSNLDEAELKYLKSCEYPPANQVEDMMVHEAFKAGAEWRENQMKMPDSSELIAAWNEAKSVLQEKDFRGDEWRLAYNAFMFGFSKGLNTKREK